MIRAIIALLASLVTAIQAFFIYTGGQTICFNSGCAIVDSLTTVSPLYFNIAGFVFFQVLFWCLLWGRDGAEFWHKFARLLLLAGLCTEAVLVFFQYFIAEAFCSYCMVILTFIVLLNVLSGPRQIFRGIVLSSAVLVAFMSLQFRTAANFGTSLEEGSMASVGGERDDAQLYLFFSSTCAHCEKVIERLREENRCSVRFNPVDRIDDFDFAGATIAADYRPALNVNFLKNLSIKEIPVLVAIEKEKTLVFKGEQYISAYLDENCRETVVPVDYGGTTSLPSTQYIIPGVTGVEEDACPVDANCEPEPTEEAAQGQ